MLSAQGLLDVQHGRGMFVTSSLIEWFAESLYTTLRKEGASVWDVEQFEELFYPQIITLAARNITAKQGTRLREAAEEYIEVLEQLNRRYYGIIFDASDNKLFRILGMSTLPYETLMTALEEADKQL